ncbi:MULTISPECIES: ATP-binding cassette domain-containing protein [Chromohalobacter]|uniref:ABC transporter related protein n=1 Tax=Chromohalobacter israelensis (strain ATCC BAA-138 / DSM 3043 / CIP 106854 / NCIMB 13768 / 1H11) TaxID=290398 RepID=Q1QSJ0_CHRI1|nr:ATP-binding cassette domain-containing protein [Chromohalobacter salexigens]ABE60568.1 ABC transporter related protein [Chromohalobacter salexigens DSM 3043]MDO0945588.1 ATP-binding cassette domain-containing protein [Chromohalobacter salexigens]NWO55229.1 ABC transporter ATP-binding protein [Chromohalobacter salexigens]
MASLILDDIVIHQGQQRLLSLDTAVAPGEVLTVMGPSGVGKSTLLAFIAGFLSPAFQAQGRVLLEETRIDTLPAEQRHVGLLFQDPLLFPHLDVAGNLAFGMVREGTRRQRRARIHDALSSVGLEAFAGRDPATLSGGQKARVALLRVLLSQPRAILLDEPFSKLDAARRDEIRHWVFARVRDHRLPTLMVTHDEADARAAGGRILRLTERGTVMGLTDQEEGA